MLPLGLFTVADAITPRTSSMVRPMAARRAGSTCTRIAGFCWPPISTCATPATCESCCEITFSAKSSTSVMGSSSDCTARIRMGLSAGFTLRKVGGVGSPFGSWPVAALIAPRISTAAASMFRSRSNCTTTLVLPITLTEVICATPLIWLN